MTTVAPLALIRFITPWIEDWRKLSLLLFIVMVKHFCNIYGSKNAEWLSLVYWDCLVYPAIRASYGVRYPL